MPSVFPENMISRFNVFVHNAVKELAKRLHIVFLGINLHHSVITLAFLPDLMI